MTMKHALAEILKTKNWSRYRLAQETGISQQVLSKWSIRGAKHIGLPQLVALKRGTGISWSRLGELIEKELDSEE